MDQYVQYLLDNFNSVDEIIASDASIRLRPTPSGFTKIHFFATDSTGKSIVIELLNGKMVYHTKDTMPVKAITNSTYESSTSYIKTGTVPDPYSTDTRFYRIAKMIEDYIPNTSGDVIDYTFNILDAVKSSSRTQFQTSFDIKNRVIYFKSKQNPQLRYFHFDAFDFSCQTVSKMLDINENLTGNVTAKFSNYTTQANETLIKTAWEGLGYYNVYLPALQIISRYSETFACNGTTEIDEFEYKLPIKIELNQNFPNPFNPHTNIKYSLNGPSKIKLDIYNVLGQKIKTLVYSFQNAGVYSIVWNGTDDYNGSVGSGVYIYMLETEKSNLFCKMILLK